MQSTFFCLGKFLKKNSRRSMLFYNKREYLLSKHMYIQPFNMEMDWWEEIWLLLEISIIFYICTYCGFTLWGRNTTTMLEFDSEEGGIEDNLRWQQINPLSATGLLTPILIGSYLEKFTCVANYDKALKMLHTQTCTWDYFFLHLFWLVQIW